MRRSLPWAPLEQAAGGGSARELAERLGIADRTVVRYRVSGRVPWWRADEYATRVGLHPGLIWGEAWHSVWEDWSEDKRRYWEHREERCASQRRYYWARGRADRKRRRQENVLRA